MSKVSGTTTDPMAELTAMTEIAKALQSLDVDSVRRVLSWAADRFEVGMSIGEACNAANGANLKREDNDNSSENEGRYDDVADLYTDCDPKSDPERALVVAYWFQELAGQQDFESASVNKELKNLGHGVSNITAALNSLISRKPQWVIQTRKSGTSKQARKRYKLTKEGEKQVQRMIEGA